MLCETEFQGVKDVENALNEKLHKVLHSHPQTWVEYTSGIRYQYYVGTPLITDRTSIFHVMIVGRIPLPTAYSKKQTASAILQQEQSPLSIML